MDHWSNFVPIVFMICKLLVLGIFGFFAVKWHFDEEKRVKAREAKEKETKEVELKIQN